MGLFDRKQTPQSEPMKTIVGSAHAYRVGRESFNPQVHDWQERAWTFYDKLGEFRFGVNWLANMIARVWIIPARATDGDTAPEPIDSGPAHDLVYEMTGGIGKQGDLMSKFALNLAVAGEVYIVGETVGQGSTKKNKWYARSTSEIRSRKEKYRTGTGTSEGVIIETIDDDASVASGKVKWRQLPRDSFVARVWRNHPRVSYLADSPTNPATHIMRSLELVNQEMDARRLSRLASAGILMIPSEANIDSNKPEEDENDPVAYELIETGRIAIQTPGTPASVLPMILRMPDDMIEHVKLLQFESPQQAKLLEDHDKLTRRLATSLDLPAEVMLGIGDINHWGAWQIEESGIKAHIEPLVQMICSSLTQGYLWPRLESGGMSREQAREFVVWYDTSPIVLRPDRSEAAKDGYDRYELSAEAYRRATGFDEADAPTDDEIINRIIRILAQQPQTAQNALSVLTGERATLTIPPTGEDEDSGERGSPPSPQGDAGPEDSARDRASSPVDGEPPSSDQTPNDRGLAVSAAGTRKFVAQYLDATMNGERERDGHVS